jgi:hypothetical protein
MLVATRRAPALTAARHVRRVNVNRVSVFAQASYEEAVERRLADIRKQRAWERMEASKRQEMQAMRAGMLAFAQLEARLGKVPQRVTRPAKPPVEPALHECCGNDCANCVWIQYWEKLQEWERSQ